MVFEENLELKEKERNVQKEIRKTRDLESSLGMMTDKDTHPNKDKKAKSTGFSKLY
jgi:hypothetical protein